MFLYVSRLFCSACITSEFQAKAYKLLEDRVIQKIKSDTSMVFEEVFVCMCVACVYAYTYRIRDTYLHSWVSVVVEL